MLDPEKYEKNKSVAARDAALFVPKIIDIMDDWKSNENIMDYGCGAGSTGYNFILPQVEKFDSRLYSVDISNKMVEFAKSKYSHPRITYANGDIMEKFPFEEVQFDKIFAIYVFHFIQDIQSALMRFRKILKPKGQLGCTLVTKSFFTRSFHILAKSDKWGNYMKDDQEFSPTWMNYEEDSGHEFITDLLDKAGFHIVHLEIQKRSFPFDNIDTMLELYMSLFPSLRAIPEDLHFDLKEDFRKLVTQFAEIPLDSKTIVSQYEFVLAVVENPKGSIASSPDPIPYYEIEP